MSAPVKKLDSFSRAWSIFFLWHIWGYVAPL